MGPPGTSSSSVVDLGGGGSWPGGGGELLESECTDPASETYNMDK